MLNKKYSVLIISLLPFFFSTSFLKNEKLIVEYADNWSGKVSWTKTSASKGKKKWDDHGHENVHRWDFSFEFRIDVSFKNGKGTIVRADYTSRSETDSIIFIHPENKYMIESKTTMISCNGQEVSDLTVEFSEDKKHYWISFYTPTCTERLSYEVRNNIHGNTSNSSVNDHQGGQITLPANSTGQPVGNNPSALSGTFEETIPAPNDEGGGEIITKATWSFTKRSL